jgi:hypothetical protein
MPMSRSIVISTEFDGEHKDWVIEQDGLDDAGRWTDYLEPLFKYTIEVQERAQNINEMGQAHCELDGMGPVNQQIDHAAAALSQATSGHKNLTLAVSDTQDMHVYIKVLEGDA